MNRQLISKAQKPNDSALLPANNIMQRRVVNRTDYAASTDNTRIPSGQQSDKRNRHGSEYQFSHDFTKVPVRFDLRLLPIQAKLKIGQPNDKYEQEADQVAEQVMRMPDSQLTSSVADSALANSTNPHNRTIQRTCASCSAEYKTAEEEKRPVKSANLCPKCRTQGQGLMQTKRITPLVQTKTTADVTPEVTPEINSGIQSLQGGGRPLSDSERGFFEPRFGMDFSGVRVHNGARATGVARSINARAFMLGDNVVFGDGEFSSGSIEGRKLLAHELTHVAQQNGGLNRFPEIIQRDLALELPSDVAVQPDLTNEQIQEAIKFNRRRYSENNIRQIQDIIGSEITGVFDEDTIRLIAQLQEDFGFKKDGKVGSDTFDLINRELTAEGAETNTCLTSFRVTGPHIPMDLRALPGSLANIFTRFDVDISFSSRCNCSDFDYRQYICGDVTRTTGGVTTSENHVFSNLPAGQLLSCPDWREDGDTSVPIRYGHRSAAGRAENHYMDDAGNVDQANGCRFEGFDVPGIWGLTAVSGSRYDFDIRFFGDVHRNGVGRLERKFWAVRDSVNIP